MHSTNPICTSRSPLCFIRRVALPLFFRRVAFPLCHVPSASLPCANPCSCTLNPVEQLDLEEIADVQKFLEVDGSEKLLKVYESIVKVLYDDHDGLGALIIQSTEAENEMFSSNWYAKAYEISVCGRSINQPASVFGVKKKKLYLKIYYQPDDSADGGKELLLQTSAAKSSRNPEWKAIKLFMSDEANDVDSSLCFTLRQEGMAEDNSPFKIGTPVARKYNSSKSASRSIERQGSRNFNRSTTLMTSLHRGISSSVTPASAREERVSLALGEDTSQYPLHKKRKFGVIKDMKGDDINESLIGVDFSSNGSDNLDWFSPESLELLHVGDKLDTVIVECCEDGSDTVN
jgi:hypothetical protein